MYNHELAILLSDMDLLSQEEQKLTIDFIKEVSEKEDLLIQPF